MKLQDFNRYNYEFAEFEIESITTHSMPGGHWQAENGSMCVLVRHVAFFNSAIGNVFFAWSV